MVEEPSHLIEKVVLLVSTMHENHPKTKHQNTNKTELERDIEAEIEEQNTHKQPEDTSLPFKSVPGSLFILSDRVSQSPVKTLDHGHARFVELERCNRDSVIMHLV